MSLYLFIGGLVAVLGIVVWAISRGRQAGRDAERVDEQEEILDDVALAKRTREHLARDPDERQRVRDRHTRP